MTSEPARAGRPDNLFSPPPGDPGAHGRFDARAVSGPYGVSSAVARAGVFALGLAAMSGAALIGRAMRGDAPRRRLALAGPRRDRWS
jgi:hypothetical protein